MTMLALIQTDSSFEGGRGTTTSTSTHITLEPPHQQQPDQQSLLDSLSQYQNTPHSLVFSYLWEAYHSLVSRKRPVGLAFAQNAGDDGGQDSGQDDMSQQDPNLVNPTNRQGYGKDVPSQVIETKPLKQVTKTEKTKSMAEQTTQAALQLGVLVSNNKLSSNILWTLSLMLPPTNILRKLVV